MLYMHINLYTDIHNYFGNVYIYFHIAVYSSNLFSSMNSIYLLGVIVIDQYGHKLSR